MKRSKFNLSHYKLLTGDMGKLYPVCVVEVLPGDSFQHASSVLVRLSPMTAPVMHGMTVRLHSFFVPNRLVWEGWEDFITGGPDGNDATVPPMVPALAGAELLDYMGVTPGTDLPVNALPVRAYNMIYNQYYRDQDLSVERAEDDLTIATAAWDKDYFTTARPWPQKGPEVTIPLGTTAPVTGSSQLEVTNMDGSMRAGVVGGQVSGTNVLGTGAQNLGGSGVKVVAGLEADLAAASAASINDLRRAFAIQRFQEARAQYGSRYTEYLRYLGVNPPDSRLQRPEYLGGGYQYVNVSEVLQTAPEVEGSVGTEYGVGDLYGHGIAALRSHRYRRFFDEHGYVISILSVRPKSIYVNGCDKHWLKRDKEEYFQRELQFIGQQPIVTEELFAGDPTKWGTVFGYQDRYAEYRECHSRVAGEFRDLLKYWHLGREFSSAPALNSTFVECQPSKRIFNVQTEDVLWMMVHHKIGARRLVAKHPVARII